MTKSKRCDRVIRVKRIGMRFCAFQRKTKEQTNARIVREANVPPGAPRPRVPTFLTKGKLYDIMQKQKTSRKREARISERP